MQFHIMTLLEVLGKIEWMGPALPRYLLVLLSFAIFISGGIAFVAGLLLKLESGFLEADVKTLFNYISYNGIYMGHLTDALAYMMIVFGAILMALGVVGALAGWIKIRNLLLVYVILIIVMIVAQGVLVGFWVSARVRNNEWLKGRMLDLLKSYKGPQQTDSISKGWDTLFMTAECCGLDAQYANGGVNNDFQDVQSEWWNSHRVGSEVIPGSCCQGVTSDTVSSYSNSATCTNVPKNFYTAGCYEKVKEYIDTYSLVIIITVGPTVAIEVTAIICACLIMSAINKITHI